MFSECNYSIIMTLDCLFSSEVEHCICNAMVVGSNPTEGLFFVHADVAQW